MVELRVPEGYPRPEAGLLGGREGP